MGDKFVVVTMAAGRATGNGELCDAGGVAIPFGESQQFEFEASCS